jgi:hypothetical protein
MECHEAKELALESLMEPLPGELEQALRSHADECRDCKKFIAVQRELDGRLIAASGPSLSPRFRPSLAARIAKDAQSTWPEFLPDLAHLAGCAGAAALGVVMLPWQTTTVLAGAAGFTLLTYFMQAVLRSSIERG